MGFKIVIVEGTEPVLLETIWGLPNEMFGRDGDEYNWRSLAWLRMLNGDPAPLFSSYKMLQIMLGLDSVRICLI